MKRLVFFLMALVIALGAEIVQAEEFIYRHRAGDKYRIISTVTEDVIIDNKRSHTAEILNRIAVEVISEENGTGTHHAVFQTSERTNGGRLGVSFQWAREYESEFERDPLGHTQIDKQYFMPVVRDVPVFPGRDLQPGDTWSHEGHEAHDFRDSFGIEEPYLIPFMANYVFLGDRIWKEKTYPAFSVNYKIDMEPQAVSGNMWPQRITAESSQIVYWDSVMGQPAAYNESFNYRFEFSNGRTILYRGTAEAEIVESQRMDREKMVDEIQDEIEKLGIPDVSVRAVDEGIAISLDDIQFQADTAVMLPGERGKLDRIAEILARYGDRDIAVGGHTALAGTAVGRKQLSLERAAVVADYLIGKKVRTADRVTVRGYGAERPLADNATEEGRSKNRRVEIMLLEN